MANENKNPENIQAATANNDAANKDYAENFMPNVHRIGRSTMAIAFCLSFLPVVYFIVVRGYTMPISAYINTTIAICSIGIGMWLSEPLSYWPVLGSAGTYISYFSGNVGSMRFPVALNVQSTMNADINTPRGQIITIVGIVASVFSNLIILLIIVLAGNWLLTILPEAIIASFSFVMPCLLGSMILMRFNGKSGLAKGFLDCLPYLATAIICKVLITNVFTFLSSFGMAISVILSILVGYILYRRRLSKQASNA